MLVAEAIVRSVHYLATAGLAAFCACPVVLQVRPVPGLARVERALAVSALGSWFAVLVVTLLMWNDGSWQALGDPVTWRALAGTSFGWIWCWRFVLLLVCAVLCIRPVATLRTVQIGLVELACMSIALTGHAHADPRWIGLVHVGIDAVHLLAATLWPGGLLWLFLLLRPGRIQSPDLARCVSRFSTMSLAAAATLLLTGIGNTLLTVDHWDLHSRYLQTLAFKLALVAALLFIGSLNLLKYRPALWRATSDSERDRVRGSIRRLVAWECALAVLVFVAVGFLTLLPP